jgi:hypothetical protein
VPPARRHLSLHTSLPTHDALAGYLTRRAAEEVASGGWTAERAWQAGRLTERLSLL